MSIIERLREIFPTKWHSAFFLTYVLLYIFNGTSRRCPLSHLPLCNTNDMFVLPDSHSHSPVETKWWKFLRLRHDQCRFSDWAYQTGHCLCHLPLRGSLGAWSLQAVARQSTFSPLLPHSRCSLLHLQQSHICQSLLLWSNIILHSPSGTKRVFELVSNCSLPFQFRIAVTGVIYQIIFQRYLSRAQWVSLLLLTLGCIIKVSAKWDWLFVYFNSYHPTANGRFWYEQDEQWQGRWGHLQRSTLAYCCPGKTQLLLF